MFADNHQSNEIKRNREDPTITNKESKFSAPPKSFDAGTMSHYFIKLPKSIVKRGKYKWIAAEHLGEVNLHHLCVLYNDASVSENNN